ncbi:hypothetical protein HanPSC8_Chr16g0702271 [Helianthus annuus]|nr:hypothetical protein HanPSC8_Chr16g0702271 [Helianthus annuus]
MLKPFTTEALLLRLEPTTTAAAAPKGLAILSHRVLTTRSESVSVQASLHVIFCDVYCLFLLFLNFLNLDGFLEVIM